MAKAGWEEADSELEVVKLGEGVDGLEFISTRGSSAAEVLEDPYLNYDYDRYQEELNRSRRAPAQKPQKNRDLAQDFELQKEFKDRVSVLCLLCFFPQC